MKRAAFAICALAVLIGAQAAAENGPATGPDSNLRAYLATASRDEGDLSPLTRQTRDQLIRDPSQIAAVIEAASAASVVARGEIELGIVLAVAYLKRFDPAGYQALADYLKAHSDNPVVADISDALSALAQAGPAGGVGGGPFASPGQSPSSPQ